MTPQERDLILVVAQRLRNANLAQKDPEADRFIQAEIGSQRNALYLLTQAVIVQEQGLRHAQERIQQLEAAASPPAGHGSFLGSLFAGSSPAPPPAAPPAGPLPAGHGSGIGTFLGTAAAAAAGTVGGQLIYDSFRHLGGGGAGISWPQGGGSLLGGSSPVNITKANEQPHHGGRTDSSDVPQDTDYSGTGGDFGDQESGGDFQTDAADADGGGDFGDSDDESDDFSAEESSDEDTQGGGDF